MVRRHVVSESARREYKRERERDRDVTNKKRKE